MKFTEAEKRFAKIDNLIFIVWIWLLVQSLFIGIWSGYQYSTDGWDEYGGAVEQFSGVSFALGVLGGVGTFLPVVFIVLAIKQVVVNIVKGPLDKSEL